MYSAEIIEKFKLFGITIPDIGGFIPGTHCKGAIPYRRSQSCYEICFGTKGATSIISSLNEPPCCTDTLTELFIQSLKKGITGI